MDALVTIVAPVRDSDIPALEAAIDALGNPARDDLRAALGGLDEDGGGTHFISLHAFRAGTGETAHLVMEFTGDGSEARAI